MFPYHTLYTLAEQQQQDWWRQAAADRRAAACSPQEQPTPRQRPARRPLFTFGTRRSAAEPHACE